jgi:hypothetical protein
VSDGLRVGAATNWAPPKLGLAFNTEGTEFAEQEHRRESAPTDATCRDGAQCCAPAWDRPSESDCGELRQGGFGGVAGAFAEEQELFAAFLGFGARFGGGRHFHDFGIAAAGNFLVAGGDNYVALFAKSL